MSSNTTAYVGVAHGVFVSGQYTGAVKEVGGAQLASDVASYFMRFAHCAENKIDADDVGRIAAGVNPGDTYPSSPSDGGGGSGGGSSGGTSVSGYYQAYTSEVWIWYIQPNGHLAAYRTEQTVFVWIPTPDDPGNQNVE